MTFDEWVEKNPPLTVDALFYARRAWNAAIKESAQDTVEVVELLYKSKHREKLSTLSQYSTPSK